MGPESRYISLAASATANHPRRHRDTTQKFTISVTSLARSPWNDGVGGFLRPSRSKKERSVEVEVANHIKPPEFLLGLKTAPSQVQLGTNLSDTSMLCLVLRSQAAASLQSYVAMPMKVRLVAMSDLLCGDITRSQVRNLRQDIFWACFLGRLTKVPHASSHATLGGVGASSEARIHGADQSVWDHAAPLPCCQVGCFFSCFFTC